MEAHKILKPFLDIDTSKHVERKTVVGDMAMTSICNW